MVSLHLFFFVCPGSEVDGRVGHLLGQPVGHEGHPGPQRAAHFAHPALGLLGRSRRQLGQDPGVELEFLLLDLLVLEGGEAVVLQLVGGALLHLLRQVLVHVDLNRAKLNHEDNPGANIIKEHWKLALKLVRPL